VSNLIDNKKVALFVGCFANYYYPEVGMAALEVLQKNDVDVIVPDQVCCGLPMMAKQNSKGTYKNMIYNAAKLQQKVAEGYVILTTCSSCSLFMKRNYVLYGNEDAVCVANNTYHFSEYLLKLYKAGSMQTGFQTVSESVFYQTPCHLRAIRIGQPTIEILRLVPGIILKHISDQCCGMGGAYGFDKAHYRVSCEIGKTLTKQILASSVDRVVTDCGGCKLQIEAYCGCAAEHPLLLLQEAYGN